MQHCLLNMIGNTIKTTDGELGKVSDFYFDDLTWTIRYVVAETGSWLSERKVLISLASLDKPDWESHSFLVNLTSVQVRNSPDIDTQRPVSRQHEIQLHEYYRWSRYWDVGYGGVFGITQYPLLENPLFQKSSESERHDDLHLRSAHKVAKYHIHATDGEIGHIEDFIVDDKNWALRYLIVNIGKWLPGRNVLISTKWIKNVNWSDNSVYLDRSRDSVKLSPDFDPSEIIHHEYEYQ